jgi:hypothetical protein
LLKSYFGLMFDKRLSADAMAHLTNRRGGQGDLRTFVGTCRGDISTSYPSERVTSLFCKIFMGVRRYFLGPAWHFVPQDKFQLYQLQPEGQVTALRRLPLAVGGTNPPFAMLPRLLEAGNERKYRDFYFSSDGNILSLRYGRADYGNQLSLVAIVDESPSRP